MPIVPDSLTSLPTVQAELGTADSEDALISALIPQVSALITRSLRRTHVLASNAACPITEYLGGRFVKELPLRQWPVQPTALAVWVDDYGYYGQPAGAFASTTQLTLGTDYVLRVDQPDGSSKSGILDRIDGVWPGCWERQAGTLASYPVAGKGNIKVTYTPGYTVLPADLEMAAILTIAKIRNLRQYGQALQSESYENYAYTLAALPSVKMGVLSGDVGAMLAPFRILAVLR